MLNGILRGMLFFAGLYVFEDDETIPDQYQELTIGHRTGPSSGVNETIWLDGKPVRLALKQHVNPFPDPPYF